MPKQPSAGPTTKKTALVLLADERLRDFVIRALEEAGLAADAPPIGETSVAQIRPDVLIVGSGASETAAWESVSSSPGFQAVPVVQIGIPEIKPAGGRVPEIALAAPVQPAVLAGTVLALLSAAPPHAAEILDSIADPVVAFDKEWRYTYVSGRAAAILGRSPGEMIGRSMWDLFPADADTGFQEACARAWDENRPVTVERYSRVLDTWVESYIYPFENGACTQWRDVTARKRAERALRESEHRLAMAQSIGRTGCFELDLATNKALWSDELQQLYGFRPGEFDGRLETWADCVLPEDRGHAIAGVEITRQRGENSTQFRIRRRDTGEVRWMEARGRVVHDEFGPAGKLLGFNIDVTAQKQAEEALQESESRYRTLFESMQEGFAIGQVMCDAAGNPVDWRYIDVNPAMASMLGLEKSQIVGRTYRELFPDAAWEFWVAAFGKVALTGAPARLENYGSGTQRYYDAIVHSPRPGQFAAILTDITERKAAEVRLQESEARLRATLHSILDELWIVDADGRVVFVNEAVQEHLGVPPERWDTLYAAAAELEIFYQDGTSRRTDQAPLARALRGERLVGEREIVRNRATGELRWREVSSGPIRAADGRLAGAVLIARDITEWKKAERALADAVQRLDAHMDNSPLAVVEFDPRFRVTRWSKEAERMFGWAAGEVLGRAVGEMRWVHEDDRDKVAQVGRDMLTGKRPRNLSVNRNYRSDGSVVECEWYNSAIYGPDGKLTSILSQVLDVTERKRAEERLRQAQKLESIGLLAGGIAHDFNNLLTGILGNASLAMEQADPENAAILRGVVSNAERAAHLTRQLLAYSGKGQFFVQNIDLSRFVAEIRDLLRLSLQKNIALEFDLQKHLPAVPMDAGQLQQVVMNLAINAGEAIGDTAAGSVAIATSVRDVERSFVDAMGEEIPAGRYVVIEVADSGPGIDEAARAKIFEPFFTTKFTGRGLGLAAVSGIMRALHGGIVLDTAPGRGARFTLYFRPAEAETAAVREPERRGTVLVIDDEEYIRSFLTVALERHGYRVLAAKDGREALSVSRNGELDLVILDVVMPVMAAGELLPEIQRRRPGLQVLLTSGYSEAEARRLCAALPGTSFIQKPYTAREIVAAVEKLVRPARG